MSLDICAYKNITHVPEEQVKRDEYGDVDYSNVDVVIRSELLIEQNQNFPGRAEEFKDGEFIKGSDKAHDRLHFGRSYGRYNKWRDALYAISEDFYDLWE